MVATLHPGELSFVKTRYHGDYHLGQVLVCGDDFVIIDFEGELGRTLKERRCKGSPLKDVAGVLRSFDYAAATAFGSCYCESPVASTAIQHLLKSWRYEVKAAFLEGYRAAVKGCPSLPEQPWQVDRLIGLFSLEKALYEVRYELANRPQWVSIPLADLVELTDENDTEERHD